MEKNNVTRDSANRPTTHPCPPDHSDGNGVFPVCPVPHAANQTIQMAHGGGGRRSRELLENCFLSAFANPALNFLHDGAVLEVGEETLAFSTDSHVVSPLFFPGGDIGKLAVWGTVNDLLMCGAQPLWLSAGFILEEGLPMETLQRVVDSMRTAALESGVTLVTGDTKVVDRGKGDGLYINTSGIGRIACREVGPARIRPGDAVLISGDLARHGIAVMALREGLDFENEIASDCACLARPVQALFEAGIDVHCLRDLTRGGLASALVEIATDTCMDCRIEETSISVDPTVRGACELLGLDPLHVANEGRFVAFLPPEQAEKACSILATFESSVAIIGTVTPSSPDTRGRVILKSPIGVDRIVDMLSGEQLPRIC